MKNKYSKKIFSKSEMVIFNISSGLRWDEEGDSLDFFLKIKEGIIQRQEGLLWERTLLRLQKQRFNALTILLFSSIEQKLEWQREKRDERELRYKLRVLECALIITERSMEMISRGKTNDNEAI